MAKEDSSRDIDQAAAIWAARLDGGPLVEQDERRLENWLKHDQRAQGALLRAQAFSMMSESAKALGSTFDPRNFEQSKRPIPMGVSRRRALTLAGGVAGAASLIALGVGVSAAGAVSRTQRGEIRLVPLEDGSTALLNTLSCIRVRYDGRERKVTLLEGEAYFSVARDTRPFILEVKGQSLRATQATFSVRSIDEQPIDVLVNEGLVDVSGAVAVEPLDNGRALTANTRLVISHVGGTPSAHRFQRVEPETVTRELAWREGKLAFQGESLQQAAMAFARYSNTRIQIEDAALAREPVTGLFAANDPIGFSRAVARVFGATLNVGAKSVVLTQAARSK